MRCRYLAFRAARAAVHQRKQGDQRALRDLYRRSFSFLRFFHRQWEATH